MSVQARSVILLSLGSFGLTLVLLLPPSQAQEGEHRGLIQSVGQGTPGANGVPRLEAVGVPLEDKAFWLRVTHGLAGSRGMLIGSTRESATFRGSYGNRLYPGAPFLFVHGFMLDGQGESPPLLQQSAVPALCGVDIVAQAVVLDRAAAQGKAFSQALRIRFGGPSEGPLFPGHSVPVGIEPVFLAIDDLDADGWPDMVVSNFGTDAVSVVLGAGGGEFKTPVAYPAGDDPRAVAIGDLNQDGVPDLVVANFSSTWGDDDVSVLLGSGDGTFLAPKDYPAGPGPGPHTFAMGDLDGDGVPDLVVPHRSSDNFSVLMGLGNGGFSAPQDYPAGNDPNSVAIGDLNGDGRPDVAVGTLFSAEVSVWLGTGGGALSGPQIFPANQAGNEVAIEDLDGDGLPELVLASQVSTSLDVLPGLGDGSFSGAEPVDVAGPGTLSIAIEDLNADGILDIAVGNSFSAGVSVLLGLGAGDYMPPRRFAAGTGRIAIEDMDGDGTSDLVVVDRHHGAVSLLRGLGDGTFFAIETSPAAGKPAAMAIDDLDGDGVHDVVVANQGSGEVAVLFGTGGGNFSAPLSFRAGGAPSFVAIGDMDADGLNDMAVTNESTGTVSVLPGLGGGAFGVPRRFHVGVSPVCVAIGDLDGNAIPDMAVANHGGDSVSVLLGLGQGRFAKAQGADVGGPLSRAVVIGDLDDDGVPDLVVVNEGGFLSVLVGNGDGTYRRGPRVNVGQRPKSAAIADIDGDGKQDVVVANELSDDVSVLLGRGDGGFEPAQSVFTGGGNWSFAHLPRGVAIADLDGDAVLDLAVINGNTNDLSFLAGLGHGRFAPPRQFVVGAGPVAIAVQDLDADGVPDLVAATSTAASSGVSVILNQLMK